MAERVGALALLAASALYLAVSLGFPLGTSARPGPGFFPVGVGAFLCGVAAVFVLATFRRAPAARERPPRHRMDPGRRGRVATTIACLVGFCVLLPWTGYELAAFVFVSVLMRRLGGSGWLVTLVAAALGAWGSAHVFGVLLGVPLPRGVLLG